MSSTASKQTSTAWPVGVVARYLNLVGAPVDVFETRNGGRFDCTGCPDGDTGVSRSVVHGWAQSHSEKCRAMPRPTA
jgi:hypothetical protein